MSSGRFTVLPEPGFATLRSAVEARVREAAEQTCGEGFESIFDPTMRALLTETFRRVGAHEGTVWLLDRAHETLVPRFNNGPHAAKFVGEFRQSIRSGIISMVLAMAQPICENDVHKNARQDKTLDRLLGLETCSMLAVPFLFAGAPRGVISCVQVRDSHSATECAGFGGEDLRALQLTAGILSRLIESRLLALCLGLDGLA